MGELRDQEDLDFEILELKDLKFLGCPPDGPTQRFLLVHYQFGGVNEPMPFVFSLDNVESENMENKCWLTCSSVKKIEDEGPNPYPGYGKFRYKGTTFFPYSVGLSERLYTANSIKELCVSLPQYMDHDNLMNRTEQALDAELLDNIQNKRFCIVGCGAVGAAFAEMLVRTGARKITLIDGDDVAGSNLNRVIGFLDSDKNKKKVSVIENHLRSINPKIEDGEIRTIAEHYRSDGSSNGALEESDIIVIAMDNLDDRISCSEYCQNKGKDFLSIGILIDGKDEFACYQCSWKKIQPRESQTLTKYRADGYGAGNGSFVSIVLEATSVGFNMMMHNMKNPDSSKYKYYYKEYRDLHPFHCSFEPPSRIPAFVLGKKT